MVIQDPPPKPVYGQPPPAPPAADLTSIYTEMDAIKNPKRKPPKYSTKKKRIPWKSRVPSFSDRSLSAFRRKEKYDPFMPLVKGGKPEADPDDDIAIEKYTLRMADEVKDMLDDTFHRYVRSAAREVPEDKQANLVASIAVGSKEGDDGGLHFPIFDFDFPCKLVPSQTEDSWHLYMRIPVSWDGYKRVLWAMAEAGMLNPGWVAAAISQGYSVLRPSMSHIVEEIRVRVEAGETPGEVLDSIKVTQPFGDERYHHEQEDSPSPPDVF